MRAFWQANPCGVKVCRGRAGAHAVLRARSKRIATRRSGTFHCRRLRKRGRAEGSGIGCGLGTDGAQFAEAGADYTGVDLTDAAVDLARKRLNFSIFAGSFKQQTRKKLDFADESFDLVYSHGVLHHTPELRKPFKRFIACCVRWTRRGDALPSDSYTIASTFRCCAARARIC